MNPVRDPNFMFIEILNYIVRNKTFLQMISNGNALLSVSYL